MENILVKKLIEDGLTISTAESCTGGMLSSCIIDVPGASNIISEAHVTYSNEAKVKYLNVSMDTLDTYSEYSEECAREMAKGVKNLAETDIGVSITGVAGPGGGTPNNPVGTVYIGISYKDTDVLKLQLKGNRSSIRKQAVKKTIEFIINKI
ncbi:CinA family protein [Mycoplasmatota bacterium zrk1]